MKRLLHISFVALLLSASTAFAVPSLIPDPPALDSHGYYLLDYHSGDVLAQKNGNEHMEPASLTKLMTAYVVFSELRAGQIHLNDKVRVSKKAWRTGGSRMFIEVGSEVSVGQLLQGMLIDSGNDAATALAEYVAGSEDTFVALMNEHAQALGDLVERFDPQRHVHAPRRAELVDQHPRAGMSLDVFEKQRRARFLHHPVGDFGDFEDGIDFGADTLQFPGALQGFDPLANVVVGHGFSEARL